MHELIPLIEEYRHFLETLKSSNLPTEFTGVIHNETMLVFEILNCYNFLWTHPSVLVIDNRLQNLDHMRIEKARRGRITSISKSCFNTIMSMFESDLKKFISNTSNENLKIIQIKLKDKKRVQLSEILESIYKAKLITQDQYTEILGITRIRNILVHNNAIPDNEDDIVKSIKDMFERFKIGETLLARPTVFLELTKKIYNFYNIWHESQIDTYKKIDIR